MTEETLQEVSATTQPSTSGGNAVTRAARSTIDTARTTALDVAEKTAQAIDGNPVAVIVGGLTVGLIAGALLPRTKTEHNVLRPLGNKLKEGAEIAVKAARDAGVAELAAAGISRDAFRDQLNRLIDAVGHAATRAGEAAKSTTSKAASEIKPAVDQAVETAKSSVSDATAK